MFAIRDERDYVVHEDFMQAVRKMNEAKKLESTLNYDEIGRMWLMSGMFTSWKCWHLR
jgi:hypothetical protein